MQDYGRACVCDVDRELLTLIEYSTWNDIGEESCTPTLSELCVRRLGHTLSGSYIVAQIHKASGQSLSAPSLVSFRAFP